MDINYSEIIFEPDSDIIQGVFIPKEIPEEHEAIMVELLKSGYASGNCIYVNRFLDEDLTIDLEKLELAIVLLIEYLEFFDKLESRIYIILAGMSEYYLRRGLNSDRMDKLAEETTFILNFCQEIADENKITRDVVIQYWRDNA